MWVMLLTVRPGQRKEARTRKWVSNRALSEMYTATPVFRYGGLALNTYRFHLELTCLEEDDRGFSGLIRYATPQWSVEVYNYFFAYMVKDFLKELSSMRRGAGKHASLGSFDDEVHLRVVISPRRSGAIAIKLMCGESEKAHGFAKLMELDSHVQPRLIADSGFIELERSYLETLCRDIGAFLGAKRFRVTHPLLASPED